MGLRRVKDLHKPAECRSGRCYAACAEQPNCQEGKVHQRHRPIALGGQAFGNAASHAKRPRLDLLDVAMLNRRKTGLSMWEAMTPESFGAMLESAKRLGVLMSPEETLVNHATEISAHLQNQMSRLQRDREKIQAELAKIDSQIYAASLADRRLLDFQAKRGGELQCPKCWMEGGLHGNLAGVGRGTSSEDVFRCAVCRSEIVVQLDRQ